MMRILSLYVFFVLWSVALFAQQPQIGLASFTGDNFHGRKTQSGEVYDKTQLTAAHLTLPFGTIVRVTNLKNQKNVEVRINDRGPFIKGRIIDLSRRAAEEIEIIQDGTAQVKLEVIKEIPATVVDTTPKIDTAKSIAKLDSAPKKIAPVGANTSVSQPSKVTTTQPSKVVKTEPVKEAKTTATQPSKVVKTEPAKDAKATVTQPFKSVKTEPAKTEPAKATVRQPFKSVKTEPAKTEPAKATVTQPSKVVKTEPVKEAKTTTTQPSKTVKTEPAKTEPAKPRPATALSKGGLYQMQALQADKKGFGIQVAGYSDYETVVEQSAIIEKTWTKGILVYVDELNGKNFYKIILAPIPTKPEASTACEGLRKKYKNNPTFKDAFVVDLSELK
jgi:rare lipoprotein A